MHVKNANILVVLCQAVCFLNFVAKILSTYQIGGQGGQNRLVGWAYMPTPSFVAAAIAVTHACVHA